MTHNTAQSLIDDLDDLLEQERAALIDGDLERISRLLARKEGLIDALNMRAALDQADLAPLHAKVTRNQALLNSAMEGIRAVASGMSALRRARQGLETYDRTGTKHQITTGDAHTVERRA